MRKVAPWLLMLLVAALLVLGAVHYGPRAFAQRLFFIRVPLLSAIVLFSLPIIALSWGRNLIGNLLPVGAGGAFAITLLALLAAWVDATAASVIWNSAHARFSLPDVPPPAFLDLKNVKWSSALAVILIVVVWWKSPAGRARAGAGVLGGIGAAAAVYGLANSLPGDPTEYWLLGTVFQVLSSLFAGLGPGYVGVDGKLRSDHAFALAGFVVLLLLYTVCYLMGSRTLGRGEPKWGLLPSLAYVLILLMLLTAILSAFSFFLDRFRLPLILFVVLWTALAYFTADTDHIFFVSSPPQGGMALAAAGEGVHASLAETKGPAGGGKPAMIVVCASGGGIQAAAWTARVLTGLQEEFGESFARSIRLISSVSGGSVGSLYYVGSYDPARGVPPQDRLDAVLAAAATSSLEATAWGIACPDLLRIFVPLLVTQAHDRGWAIEQAWARALAGADDLMARRLSDWSRDVARGRRPGAVFNATIAESGNRLLLSTVDFPATPGAIIFGKDPAYAGADLSVVTAARLSATFPYVSPIARAADRAEGSPIHVEGWHVADGGYYDNFGVMTAIEWLRAVIDRYRSEVSRIAIVQIRAFPEDRPAPELHSGWIFAAAGPVKTIMKVRTSTQIARNDLEIQMLQDQYRGLIETVVFRPRDAGPLSWHLSEQELERLKRDWREDRWNRDEARKLGAWLA